MKKVTTCIMGIIAGLFLAVVVFYMSIVVQNDKCAEDVEKKLLAIPLPEKTECVDSVSEAGKLIGNGNGMQYFGAILLKSELSLEELQVHYEKYRDEFGWVAVQEQKGHTIMDGGQSVASFDAPMSVDVKYYVVYDWGDGDVKYGDLDLRGH